MNQTESCHRIKTLTQLITLTATCVVDANAVDTFDNTSYPIKLASCWHVMMMEVPKNPAGVPGRHQSRSFLASRNQTSNVAVLVRGSNSGPQKVSDY
jgi:hypothetical protein